VLAYSKEKPGWHITPAGQEFFLQHSAVPGLRPEDGDEEVTIASGAEVVVPHIVVQAAAFERYMLDFMRVLYPSYSWYHQGRHKSNERRPRFDRYQAPQGDWQSEAHRRSGETPSVGKRSL